MPVKEITWLCEVGNGGEGVVRTKRQIPRVEAIRPVREGGSTLTE